MSGRLLLRHGGIAAVGLAMGFSLSRIGFSDYGQVHRMLTLGDLRMTLAFAGAVVLLAGAFAWFARTSAQPRRRVHRGCVLGGLLFGAGWALSGACPAIAIVQLGECRLPALLTLAGIALGTAVYPAVHRRYFRWDSVDCGS